jgi:hypothetical protein
MYRQRPSINYASFGFRVVADDDIILEIRAYSLQGADRH